MKKVSVITVCYNSEATIGRTIKSVNVQDHPKIEHIIVDGDSTDSTMSEIHKHNNDNLVVISEKDRGIYDAMNKGLNIASGDIVCFLNADDYYAQKNVLSLISSLMEKEKLDALMGDVGFFKQSKPNSIVRLYNSSYFKPSRLKFGWMPAHPALFLDRSITDKTGQFKTEYKIAGDFEYIIRIFHAQQVKYRHIKKVLVLMQDGGVSTGGLKSKLILNREVLKACRQNGIRTNLLFIISRYAFKLLELVIRK